MTLWQFQCAMAELSTTTGQWIQFNDIKVTYSADSSSCVDDKTPRILNDCCQLLTFTLQLYTAIFHLHTHTNRPQAKLQPQLDDYYYNHFMALWTLSRYQKKQLDELNKFNSTSHSTTKISLTLNQWQQWPALTCMWSRCRCGRVICVIGWLHCTYDGSLTRLTLILTLTLSFCVLLRTVHIVSCIFCIAFMLYCNSTSTIWPQGHKCELNICICICICIYS